MAPTAPTISQPKSPTTFLHQPPKMTSIKTIAESPTLTSIPSAYTFTTTTTTTDSTEPIISDDPEISIPIIDFSLLTSCHLDQRSKAIQHLGEACREWGFFMVINHGVSEDLMKGVIDACNDFFNLTDEEKREFEGKHVLDPIRCGTSFNASVDKVLFWRDFLKVFVHPEFHSPNKPLDFRSISVWAQLLIPWAIGQRSCLGPFCFFGLSQTGKISFEHCKKIREIARELLKGISESLGLEPCYIYKALDLEKGLQIFVANFYPACPQPELAMGMPPHSDHGLLTLLIQNGIGGLQLMHNGKWVNVDAVPNSILVNTGDHIEILSNGKYKSVLHRAVVNSKAARISLAVANGPSLETIVSPAPELVDNESNPPAYIGMKYKDYLENQQSNQLNSKSCLDRVRI